jgi:hypothetical protein
MGGGRAGRQIDRLTVNFVTLFWKEQQKFNEIHTPALLFTGWLAYLNAIEFIYSRLFWNDYTDVTLLPLIRHERMEQVNKC